MNKLAAICSLLSNSLKFRVEVSLDELEQLIKENAKDVFFPVKLHRLPALLKEKIGPTQFAEGNPNNGRFDNITVEIGNENSFCVYVTSMLYYRKTDSGLRQKNALESIGKTLKADENDVNVRQSGNGFPILTARYWWD